jgi:hypothetical protein
LNDFETLAPELDRWQQRALLAGGAGLAVCLIGGFVARDVFFHAYLMGFIFWAGVALGCTAFLMLHHMVGGGWGFVIQRMLEAGTRTFPLLAVLFLPLLLGIGELYEWSHAEVVEADVILKGKSAYLNVPFFLGRAAFYFVVWIGMAHLLSRWSLEMDRTGGRQTIRRLQYLSGVGLLLYGLTVTFAAVDWVMSLEPHWFSTMYGLLFIVGQGVSTLAFLVLVLRLASEHPPLHGVIRQQHFHDLGNLMLAFVMLWAYISFSQFLIIWSGNLPEENVWYLHRLSEGWQIVAVALLVFHWAVPFVLLLSRKTKRNLRTLALVGAGLILMRLVDLYWLIAPTAGQGHGGEAAAHGGFHWVYLVTPVGIGGIWVWYFLRQLRTRPLLPQGDERWQEILRHAHEHAH